MSNTNIRKIYGYNKKVGSSALISIPPKLMHKYFLRNGDFVEFKALDDGTLQIIPLVKVKKHSKRD